MGAAFCQQLQCVKVAANERFFLGTAPAFPLPLGGNCIRNTSEFLVVHKRHRSPSFRVPTKCTLIMFSNAAFKSSARRPDIVAVIGAAKNVDECCHLVCGHPSRRSATRCFSG